MSPLATGARWAGVAAVVVAAMALGRVVTDVAEAEPPRDPFVRSAEVGETAGMEYADVRVTAVRSAATLDDGSTVIVPVERFLLVDVEVTSTAELTTFLGHYLVDADGRRFVTEARTGCAENLTPAVGVAWRATFCFDVPRDAVEGMHFVLSRGDYGTNGDDQRRDEVADVDLAIDRAAADELWRTEERVEVDRGGPS